MTTLGLEEIARLAGVSRSTVSRVVNDHPSVRPAVRERVQRIIAETGFQPNAAARSLASQRSYMLGLVIPRTVHTVFTDPYFPRLTQGVAQACNDHDYTLSLFIESDDIKLYPRLSRTGLMDGVVVQASAADDGLIPRLVANGLPMVVAGRPSQREGVSFVDVDNVKGSCTAVAHLVGLGRSTPRSAPTGWPATARPCRRAACPSTRRSSPRPTSPSRAPTTPCGGCWPTRPRRCSRPPT